MSGSNRPTEEHTHEWIRTRGGDEVCYFEGARREGRPGDAVVVDLAPLRPSYDPDEDAARAVVDDAFAEAFDPDLNPNRHGRPVEDVVAGPLEVARDELAEARARQDARMRLAKFNAGDDWNVYVDEWLFAFAETHPEDWIASDLWYGDKSYGLSEPPPPATMRALGPRIQIAACRGWFEKTGPTRPSPPSNMSPAFVYRSLIYRGGPDA